MLSNSCVYQSYISESKQHQTRMGHQALNTQVKIETIKLTIVLVTKGPKPWLVGEFHHLSQLCLHDNEIGYQESRIQLREQICRTLKSLPQVKNFITQVANKDIYSNENGKPVSSSVDKKSYFKQHQMLLQLLRQIYQLSYSLHVLGQDKNCVNKINESQFLIKNIDQLRSQVGLPIYKMLISFMQKE